VAERLDRHHAALVDLGGALFHAGRLDDAERVLREAMDRGYPTPGLALNYLACIAVERGDYDAMMDRYTEAARRDPQHAVVLRNVETARRWFRERGPERGIPLRLVASHDFQLLERTQQPTLPGPLPADVEEWAPAAVPPIDAEGSVARVGSTHALLDRRRLKLV
jgi:pentatricopeptide repeat protein